MPKTNSKSGSIARATCSTKWRRGSHAPERVPPWLTRVQALRHALPHALLLQTERPSSPRGSLWNSLAHAFALLRSVAAGATALAALAKRQSFSQPPPGPSTAPCLAARSTRRSLLPSPPWHAASLAAAMTGADLHQAAIVAGGAWATCRCVQPPTCSRTSSSPPTATSPAGRRPPLPHSPMTP